MVPTGHWYLVASSLVGHHPGALLTQINDQPGDSVPIQDRGLAYGDGLFETIRISRLRPLLADFHWRRLERGLQRLRIDLRSAQVAAYVTQLLARAEQIGCADGVIKVIVSRGEGGRGFAPPSTGLPMVYLSWSRLPDYPVAHYRRGIELNWCQQQLASRPWLAGIKHLNCLEYVLARHELVDTGYNDGVLRDEQGRLIETTCANIFVAQGGVLLTPALGRCGIAGTMRDWIMQCALVRARGGVREVELLEPDLASVDEIFVCNSVFGVMPVSRLGQYHWPPGPLTRAVQRQAWKLLEDDS